MNRETKMRRRSRARARHLVRGAAIVFCAMAATVSSAASPRSQHRDAALLRPKRFDTLATGSGPATAPLVQPWRSVTLQSEFAGSWIVAGDIDGDGKCEIVSARNANKDDNHYTVSVVAQRLDGSVMWRWGDPKSGGNRVGYDVACQIHDWDRDGRAEVVVGAKRRLVELDGATGKEKQSFPIPKNASDCIVFACLQGKDQPDAVLVKTRYSEIWAYDRSGKLLWSIQRPGGARTAHAPLPVDLDGDGTDEIIAGYAVLRPDGSIRGTLYDEDVRFGRSHMDCARVFRPGQSPGEIRLVVTCCIGDRLGLINGRGRWDWSLGGKHFESVDIGEVFPDVPGMEIVADIDHRPWGRSPLWVLSEKGDLLGQIVTDRSRLHLLIDWNGKGAESIVIGQPRALFDARGRAAARFAMPPPDKGAFVHCLKGDMTGDGVPDLIFTTVPAKVVYVYRNEKGRRLARGVPLGTGKNFSLYR